MTCEKHYTPFHSCFPIPCVVAFPVSRCLSSLADIGRMSSALMVSLPNCSHRVPGNQANTLEFETSCVRNERQPLSATVEPPSVISFHTSAPRFTLHHRAVLPRNAPHPNIFTRVQDIERGVLSMFLRCDDRKVEY